MTSRYRFVFPSTRESTGDLRRLVGSFCRIEGYRELFVAGFELTVHEAFVNAVIHGNRENPSLPVTIELFVERGDGDSSLEVRVTDCGPGFNPEMVPDPRTVSEEPSAGGRGLFLIRQFTRSMQVSRRAGGTMLTLRYIPF